MHNSNLTLRSFAKINWSLRVLGKRADGYHEVATELQTISLADELRFVRRDDDALVLTCSDPSIPTNANNLVVRAGHALQEAGKVRCGANIELIKRIPAEAGLGGASSNAAIALLALCALWNLDEIDLLEIAKRLGSDVPFFLIGGRALGQGTGALVSPLNDCETKYLIVISPRAKVSTSAAYAALKRPSLTTSNPDFILTVSSAEPISIDCDQSALHNDFEAVIFEIEPEIERAKKALLQSGADGALLAGSGSSVFGIFANERARQTALERLECELGWRFFPCETLARDQYLQQIAASDSEVLSAIRKLSNTGA